MKIAFLLNTLGIGGIEKRALLLGNEFVNRGLEVLIITLDRLDKEYNIEGYKDRIKFIRLNISKSSFLVGKLFVFFKRIQKLNKILKEEKIDILLLRGEHLFLYDCVLRKILGHSYKAIGSVHTSYNRTFFNKYKILKYCAKKLDKLVILTKEDMKNYRFVEEEKLVQIYNPVILPNVCYKEEKKENIVLFIGRIEKVKRVDLLLRAWSKIKAKSWKLLIVGDGEKRLEMEELAKKLNLGNVEFLGYRLNVENFYKKAKIFLMSSEHEGFPNTLIEAMSYGVVPVAYPCPTGPKEIIKDGEDGLLAQYLNVEDLVKKIEYLIENEEVRAQMAKKAIENVKRFSIDKIVDKWMDLFNEVLLNKKGDDV